MLNTGSTCAKNHDRAPTFIWLIATLTRAFRSRSFAGQIPATLTKFSTLCKVFQGLRQLTGAAQQGCQVCFQHLWATLYRSHLGVANIRCNQHTCHVKNNGMHAFWRVRRLFSYDNLLCISESCLKWETSNKFFTNTIIWGLRGEFIRYQAVYPVWRSLKKNLINLPLQVWIYSLGNLRLT